MLAVVRVEGEERETFERVFRETWKRLEPLHETNRVRWADLIYFIIGWITHRRPVAERSGLFGIAETLASESPRSAEVKGMVVTWADELLEEGMRKGELKGELKGRAEEARRMILRLGHQRWGVADSNVETGLNAITDVDRLERIVDRLLEASSWADLLATT